MVFVGALAILAVHLSDGVHCSVDGFMSCIFSLALFPTQTHSVGFGVAVAQRVFCKPSCLLSFSTFRIMLVTGPPMAADSFRFPSRTLCSGFT